MGSTVPFWFTVSSSVYGGLFYTLIGFHGLHVVGALIWLLVVFVRAKTGTVFERAPRRTANLRHVLDVCRGFVAGTLRSGLSLLEVFG